MSPRPPSAGFALSFAAALWAAAALATGGWARAAAAPMTRATPRPADPAGPGTPIATCHLEGSAPDPRHASPRRPLPPSAPRHAEGRPEPGRGPTGAPPLSDDLEGDAARTSPSAPARALPAPGPASPTGRIAGLIRLTAAARREPRTDAYAPRAVRVFSREAVPEVTHVVVFLAGVPPQASLPRMHAVVRQRNESFEPRVVAVTRGSTVDFPNDDPFFHNVFSLSRAASFDLGRYAQGHSRSRVFPTAGLVKLFCDLHAYMSAVIFVFDHPWFAVPDATGRFVLDEVPAGRHTLKAWHERIGDSEVTVLVEPGRTSEVELVLPVLES